MRALERTIDINARPQFLTLDQVRKAEPDFPRWRMRNDLVSDIRITACNGFLSLYMMFKSGEQGVGLGYRCEGTIGMMLKWLIELWELNGDSDNVLDMIRGTPIRVFDKAEWGESIAANTYIGHFMEDRFIKVETLLFAGIKNREGEA